MASAVVSNRADSGEERARASADVQVALWTGGFDRPYAFGLAMCLAAKGVALDVIGSDELDSPEMHSTRGLRFLNVLGAQAPAARLVAKMVRTLACYFRLISYATTARPRIFHILWNYKFEYFDRTALMLYYKLRRRKVVLTVHNVNAGKRDGNDSPLNRLTLRIQYRLADHLFVHTERMKGEVLRDFGVLERAVSVVPFGINNSVPDTDLTPATAKRRLGVKPGEKTILFFGSIRPYKGLEHLVEAFLQLVAADPSYRLVIAGEAKRDSGSYLASIVERIEASAVRDRVIKKLEHIPDEEAEVYFKAADVVALPYKHIFQSGVLFLAHSFGVPVIASDVGSFRDDIREGQTGLLFEPGNASDLAVTLARYFDGPLFAELDYRRNEIRAYAQATHSWETVGDITCGVYARLLGEA